MIARTLPDRAYCRRCAFVLALALALAWTLARAQDFAPAAPTGPQPGAAALIERALPDAAATVSCEASATRWLAFTALETRAAALQLAPGAARMALGLSQTGDPELGWTAAALALGLASRDGGLAVRGEARRDRAAGALRDSPLRRDAGIEAGAGAWIAPARSLVVWASAPQMFASGVLPPLARPLEMGARWSAADLAAWAALGSPRAGGDGERTAGLALGPPGTRVWAEVRDGPLRGSFGARARARALVVEARVDAHPVLGETTRLSLAWQTPAGAEAR